MIYFLINNDYHLNMDIKLAKQLTKYKLGLIQIPYSLKVITSSDLFSKIYTFPYKIIPSLIGFIIKPNKIFKILKKVDEVLTPQSCDILLVHTEIELLNQYIIQKFYNAKAQIFLLEDGTETMVSYNIKPQRPSLKNEFKTIILNKLYGFKYTKIKIVGAEIIPVMNDFLFNGVIVNFGNSILRNIPLFKLKQYIEHIDILYKKGAIFLSQPLYFWFCTAEEYLSTIDHLLTISKYFSPFYFKFHPSDTDFIKSSIEKLIKDKYPNIIIIKENNIVENLVNKYPVGYTVTFNSTASLYLISKGITPIFLNNLFNKQFPNESLTSYDLFFDSINCRVPSKLLDVRPGFEAFPNSSNKEDTYSIMEILKLNIC